jgi:hypothetical protein
MFAENSTLTQSLNQLSKEMKIIQSKQNQIKPAVDHETSSHYTGRFIMYPGNAKKKFYREIVGYVFK